MANNDNEQYLLNEQVSFIQHFLPGLDAGEYQLQVQQQVLDQDNNPVSGEAYSNTYSFAVMADRFAIAQPGNVLSSVFPGENASGEFSNVLPHVVFTAETFPWVRYPTNSLPYQPPAPGQDTDADVPTWLWVMLLDEEDVHAYPALNLTPVTSTVANLFPPSAVPASTLGSNYSYFQGATNTDGLEPGENLSDAIQTIDVPLNLIWQIAPTVADLAQMAHGRVVSLLNQPTTTSGVHPGEPTGTFSIVFGNRLPQTGRRTTAYLVSLEGMEDFLPAEGGGAPSGNTYNGALMLRLAVLKSWTFYSTGQPATFVHQLMDLNGGQPATNLRLAYAGSNPVVLAALNMGYVPLNETMRAVDPGSNTPNQTVSWYRGPLTPYYISQLFLKLPIPSPDAAMVMDPTTGMLDVSYAAAWTIGRMVALQDTSFSVPYYNWKRDLEQQVMTSVEDHMIEKQLSPAFDNAPSSQKYRANAAAGSVKGSRALLKRSILALNPED